MSRVLFLARETPYPPNAGDRIVTYGFVRGLTDLGHEVHVCARGDRDEDAEALAAECASVTCVPTPDSGVPTLAAKAARALARRSHVMAMFRSAAFRDAAAARIRDLSPDAVVVQHPYVAQYFRDDAVRAAADATDATLVTSAHVVEYAAHERLREYADGVRERAALAAEIPPLRREELAAYEAGDRTLVLGEEDRAELARRLPHPVRTQRAGLDADAYETGTVDAGPPNRLLFFGSYDWFPNGDAVRYFAERVFPEIAARRPGAEFVIAGRGAPAVVRQLGNRERVRFLGEVDDLTALVREAAVVVAPLRVGGGVRIKILESMAWGAPVVTTRAGFEGVEATPGEELVVSDAPSEFVDGVVDLLDDPSDRRRLGDNARKRIEETYAIPAVSESLASNLGL